MGSFYKRIDSESIYEYEIYIHIVYIFSKQLLYFMQTLQIIVSLLLTTFRPISIRLLKSFP